MACIKFWYKWRYRDGEEYPDAVKRIKFKTIKREENIRRKILSPQEIKAMLRAADHPRDRAFIAVLACVGKVKRGFEYADKGFGAEALRLRCGGLGWQNGYF